MEFTITKEKVREIFRRWFAEHDELASSEEMHSEQYLDRCTDYFCDQVIELAGK